MSESTPREETASDQEAKIQRTAAFFPDSRASEIALDETIAQLIRANDLQMGIVELNSLAGVTIAAAFLKEGVPYKVLSFGGGTPDLVSAGDYDAETPATLDDAPALLKHSDGIVEAQPGQLAQIDANIVVIPAMIGSGLTRIDLAVEPSHPDFSETTLPGHIVRELDLLSDEEREQLQVLYIDMPERGLVQEVDGSYQRRVMAFKPSEKGSDVDEG